MVNKNIDLFAIISIKYYEIEGMIIGNFIATFFPSVYVVNYSIIYFNKLVKNQHLNLVI